MMPRISDKAMIEDGARIAPDVRIGPFTYVGAEVDIAPGCVIANNVTLAGKTRIGAGTRVFPLAVIGTAENGGASGECVIGEACAIREMVAVHASSGRPTRLGLDNLVMIGSVIGAGAAVGEHGIFANCTHIGEGAVVEDYVRSSAFPVVSPGVRVGAYTFINGYACVTRDAPPFAIVEGAPARVRGVNTENLKRCGFGDQDIRALKEAFRELYNGNRRDVSPDAYSALEGREDLNPHVRRLLEAIRPSGEEGDPDA